MYYPAVRPSLPMRLAPTRRRDPGSADDNALREFFVELESPLGQRADVQLFADFSHNQILLDDKKPPLGHALGSGFQPGSYTFEFDAQFPRRRSAIRRPSASLHQSLLCSSGPPRPQPLRRRADSAHLRRIRNRGRSLWHHLAGGASTSVPTLARATSSMFFAGQRRSGLACTAGICYEVLGFKGVEVRLLNRFF